MTSQPEDHGNEGFYLDAQGNRQDEKLHGSCNPSNEDGYNKAMWEAGLAVGIPVAGLVGLFGPKP